MLLMLFWVLKMNAHVEGRSPQRDSSTPGVSKEPKEPKNMLKKVSKPWVNAEMYQSFSATYVTPKDLDFKDIQEMYLPPIKVNNLK